MPCDSDELNQGFVLFLLYDIVVHSFSLRLPNGGKGERQRKPGRDFGEHAKKRNIFSVFRLALPPCKKPRNLGFKVCAVALREAAVGRALVTYVGRLQTFDYTSLPRFVLQTGGSWTRDASRLSRPIVPHHQWHEQHKQRLHGSLSQSLATKNCEHSCTLTAGDRKSARPEHVHMMSFSDSHNLRYRQASI